MVQKKRLLFPVICLLLLAACKEKYDSPIQTPITGYLVVDGIVNSGTGPASITLSRTTQFSNKKMVYEKNAQVTLQGSDSSVKNFTEKANGVYSATDLNLNPALQYRLRIITVNGARYMSDFVVVKNNPPIDSISWTYKPEGLQSYIHTHDPLNKSVYYQWYYEETWQIVSTYYPTLKYQTKVVPGLGQQFSVVYKDSSTYGPDPSIVNCWQFHNPLDIYLASTAKLSRDEINLPLAFIPRSDIKLGVLYSINLRQYTWTKEGYEFMERMKKNTESTGSVFDPQPSELKGNIHNTADAAEPVIGFFNISPVREKRIFIKPSEVPGWGYNPGCLDVEIENISDSISKKALGMLPVDPVKVAPFGAIVSFRATSPECADCTLRGTNVKPSYWP
ncbi:MAG TPA: DUF4249 domain-containing protein [Chitinophagaceae bacterium]|nr:DUF4249 domain-containing protein [Chitinophagaceae bacterium]